MRRERGDEDNSCAGDTDGLDNHDAGLCRCDAHAEVARKDAPGAPG